MVRGRKSQVSRLTLMARVRGDSGEPSFRKCLFEHTNFEEVEVKGQAGQGLMGSRRTKSSATRYFLPLNLGNLINLSCDDGKETACAWLCSR